MIKIENGYIYPQFSPAQGDCLAKACRFAGEYGFGPEVESWRTWADFFQVSVTAAAAQWHMCPGDLEALREQTAGFDGNRPEPAAGREQAAETGDAFVREVELRYKRHPVAGPRFKEPLTCPQQVVALFEGLLQGAAKEKLLALNLDAQDRLLCFETTAVGSAAAIYLRPLEVIRSAIVLNAVGLIVVHNHPSGLPEPSEEDMMFTRRLAGLCEEVGLRLKDHIIIGLGRYYSFAESGPLDFKLTTE